MTINDYEMKYQVKIELNGNLEELETKLMENREISNEEFVAMGFTIPKKKLKKPSFKII